VVSGAGRTVVDEAHTEQVYKLAHFGSVFGWNIYKEGLAARGLTDEKCERAESRAPIQE
jgi:hypothetical protein